MLIVFHSEIINQEHLLIEVIRYLSKFKFILSTDQ